MNKILQILFYLLLTSNSLCIRGQGANEEAKVLNKSILIKGSNFQGTVFQENFIFDLSPDKSGRFNVKPLWFLKYLSGDSISAWTPEESKIETFERCLYNLLVNYRTEDDYIEENTPEIIQNLEKYKRQYIGFKSNKNEKCLWVQFVLIKDKLDSPDKEIDRILGGGTSVFLVVYNFGSSD